MALMTDRGRRMVAAWLFLCAALVFAIVLVGGITRLTRSGLSIVEWQPLIGALPPLSELEWQALFAKYRETPEFRLVNHAMTLEGFKGIFWWEYIHRLLARGIGLVFLLPLLYFQFAGKLDRALALKLWGILVLGALQGAMGWIMVQSGLVDDPKVNPVRLSAHLGIALAIFAAELWIAMQLVSRRVRPFDPLAVSLPLVVFLMALSGGMVAGLRAGSAYQTFPLMNGHLVPPEVLMLEPWWRNFLYNMATVQIVHRAFFWLLCLLVPLAWWRMRHTPAGNALLAAFALQGTLGISTLLLGVPVGLGAAHQGGAVLLLAAALWNAHSAGVWPAMQRVHAPA
ncbi:MAG TPA: COX15/CtaA family protein [Burkholderiales bacterium]|nr:COX15/CtaA family protein [Burkholderiales bacterium]